MKKVLLVDTWIAGHHMNFMKQHLTLLGKYEVRIVFPQNIDDTITYPFKTRNQILSFREYIQLMKLVKTITVDYAPDMIHFLTGDYLLRYFGLFLKSINKKSKIVMTFHQYRNSFIKGISMKHILENINVGIVYSVEVKKTLNSLYTHNIEMLNYPYFGSKSVKEKNTIRKSLELDKDAVVIGCLGDTRYEKGLDLILSAMNSLKSECYLLIAGRCDYFNEKYILNSVNDPQNVRVILKYLSDEEMADCINASDIIALPYRKGFTGASGPLVEGVVHNKWIIAPKGTAIGNIVLNNQLGAVFECENINSLAEAIDQMAVQLNNGELIFSNHYYEYQKKLMLCEYFKDYNTILDKYV